MSSQNALDHALVCCKQHALSYVQRRIDEEIFQSTSVSTGAVGELLVAIVADGSKLMWKEFQSLEAGKGIKVTHPRYAAALREFQQQFNELSKRARISIAERRLKAKTASSSDNMDAADAMDVVGDDDVRLTLDAPPAATSGRSKGKKRKSHDLEDEGEPEAGEQNNSKTLSTYNKRRKSHVSFGATSDAPEETRNRVEEQAASTSTAVSSSAPSTPRRRRSILEDGRDSAEKARVKLLVPSQSSSSRDNEENVPAKAKTGSQAPSSSPAADSHRSPLDASKAKVHEELKERAAARASQLRKEKKKKK